MTREKWYMGVDGGGSKTRLILCDNRGEFLLSCPAGPTNHQSTEHSCDNFIQLLKPVRNLLDRRNACLAVAVFALSGWDFPRDRAILEANLDGALSSLDLKPEKIICDNDVFAVLKAGLKGDREGICLIAGSGVLGAAISSGKTFRTWGLDYYSGEWGSGTNIGTEGIHRVLSSALGREGPCPLLEKRAFAFFGATDPDSLADTIGSPGFDQALYTRFAAEVFAAAAGGCPGALSVLRKGGEAHARTVNALLARTGGNPVPLVLGGGIFQHNGILPGFFETLETGGVRPSEIRILKSDPVWGSLLWACEEGGLDTGTLMFLGEIRLETRSLT